MNCHLSFSVLLGLSALATSMAKPVTLHVAPDGSDLWTGSKAEAAADRQDGPLATLEAALKAARAARSSQPAAEGVTIFLRRGIYGLSKPVTLSPEDSGTDADHPLVIAAYGDEKPVLSGGRRITGWKPVPGKPGLWEAEVPAVREGKWYFRQLFVNGLRRQRARSPNEGYYRLQGGSPQDKPVKLAFKPGEIKKAWADDGDVEAIALLAWADLRMQIRAVDEAANVAILSGNPQNSNRENNAKYYIENTPDALDHPGEWYLSRKTGVVSYWALPGEDLAKAEAIAPYLTDLMLLQGDLSAKKPIKHVVLRGLTFGHTDWTLGTNGYADVQAAVNIRGHVLLEAATDCAIEDCVFTQLGGYALELGRGCQRCKIVGNEMSDLGAGGIRIGEQGKRSDPFETCNGHTITDNHIHDGGIVYPAAIGVFILQSGQNRIAHNHIHHLYYTAVSAGWNWGYQETPCRENIIEWNHLHDLGQNVLSDMGAVYTLGIQRGTVIRNNLVHDVNAFTYGGWGLYTDEGSTDIVLENNIVYRCKSAGFHQHYGRENVIRNNIFAFNKENQLMRSREESHISFIFTNNIVYFDSGNLLGSNWSNNQYRIDYNIYFDTRAANQPESVKFAGTTLDQWRQRGHDAHSLVADPGFVDPERLDFRLKQSSAALKLGFKPIDLAGVGVRPKGKRD